MESKRLFFLNVLLVFFVNIFIFFESSYAGVLPISLSNKETIVTPRWMFGEKSKRNSGTIGSLESLKKSQFAKQWKKCLLQVDSLYGKANSLSGWLSVVELSCSRELLKSDKISKTNFILRLRKNENKKSLILFGAHSELLKKEIISARLLLLKKDMKHNRARSWRSIDKLIQMDSWLSKSERSEVYNLAGDLAFIEQKMEASREFLMLSLEQNGLSSEKEKSVKERLSAIEKVLVKPSNQNTKKIKSRTEIAKTFFSISKNELELESRMKNSLKSGELSSVIEDGVKLIKKFSGSKRALWAKKIILNSYIKIDNNDKSKIFAEKERSLKKMLEVDGDRLLFWGEKLFYRQKYKASSRLTEKAFEKLKGFSQSRNALNIMSLSYWYLGDVEKAENGFKKLMKQFSGTREALSGMLRLGLIYLKKEENSKAVAIFEKLIRSPDSNRHELSGMYWLWRALQAQGVDRAENERQALLIKYPLTYYGLRARAENNKEKNKQSLDFLNRKPQKKAVNIWLTASHRLVWEKMLLLLKAGWLDEAQKELALLPIPHSENGRKVLARFWQAVLGHSKAISLVRRSISMEERLNDTDYVSLAFPQEFTSLIEKTSKKFSVSKSTLQGLIRQESEYQNKAKSRANALGLMQLIPSTAQDIAQQLGEKDLSLPTDLFDVSRNIKFGVFYFAKLIKRFNGHVPIALAAYNTGPTRLTRWLRKRNLIESVVKSKATSSWRKEMWIDEMPWSETRFYVKAILRNHIIYSFLNKPQDQRTEFFLNDPVWGNVSL